MENNLKEDEVLLFIRHRIEPVTFQYILSNYADSRGDGEARNQVATQLKDILTSLIESGNVMYYNNHYYAASLADDVETYVGFSSEGDSVSDRSTISISSADSPANTPPNLEEPDADVNESTSKKDSTAQNVASSSSSKKTASQGGATTAEEK